MNDSPEIAAKRAAVDKAIREFVEARALEMTDIPNAYVVGWAAFAEYVNIEYQQEDVSGNMVIVPDGQAASMSRGLFGFGQDAFSRAVGA